MTTLEKQYPATLRVIRERGCPPAKSLALLQQAMMQRAGIPCEGLPEPVRVEGVDVELWIRPMTISERCEWINMTSSVDHGWHWLALSACDRDTRKLLYTQSDVTIIKWAYGFDLATLLRIERQILRINGWDQWLEEIGLLHQ